MSAGAQAKLARLRDATPWRLPITGLCWWCEAPADSREHKYKRTALVNQYGPGPWLGEHRPQRVLAGSKGPLVAGPRSQEFQFSATLCRRCNNERSQPFDRAYDRFFEKVLSRQPPLFGAVCISFSEVFGSTWRIEALNLYRYFCKHIGCMLAEPKNAVQLGIPLDLIRFLDGGKPPGSVDCELMLDRWALGVARLLAAHGQPSDVLRTGPLEAAVEPGQEVALRAASGTGYGWVWFAWRTGVPGRHPFGDPVVRFGRTGSRRVLSSFATSELRVRVATRLGECRSLLRRQERS